MSADTFTAALAAGPISTSALAERSVCSRTAEEETIAAVQVHTWQAAPVEFVAAEVQGSNDVAASAKGVANTRVRLGAYALAAGATAAVLPTAFSSAVFSYTFTPKLAVLVVVAALGAVPLVRLARSSRITWVARAAIGFLAIGLISVLLSPAINIGFFGLYSWGTGWLFWFGCAGAFALGAQLRADQLDAVFGGVLLGAVVNSLTAIVQVATQPTGALTLYQGQQADGMLGNPVHLEALMLGALAIIAGRASVGKNRRLWLPLVLVLSASLELTLERAALPILVVIMAGSLIAYGLRKAAPFVVLTAVGYGMAYVWGGTGLGARVISGTASSTYGTRLHIWRLALDSLVHHPFLGIGPGEVIAVIAPRMTASFSAHLGVGTLPADSHDFAVEVLATTGILGFLAFVIWLGGAALKARGPFLAFAFAILSVELIEPLNVGITPVALLALGAATVSLSGQDVGLAALRRWWGHATATGDVVVPTADEDRGLASKTPGHEMDTGRQASAGRRWARLPAMLTALLVVASLFLGATMVVGDHLQLESYRDVRPSAKIASAKDANRLLPYWPESAAAVAVGYEWVSNFGSGGNAAVEQALSWYRTALGRDPADPTLTAQVATSELQLGNRAAAQREDLHALVLDPWTFLALEGLGTIARQEHDYKTSLFWYTRALLVAPVANDLKNLIRKDRADLTAS